MIGPLLKSLGYGRIMFQEGVTYGCALAVLTDGIDSSASATVIRSGFEPYTNSCMARGLMWVHAKLKYTDIEILFTTTHLESYINKENDGSKAREVQLKEAVKFCFDWQSKYKLNSNASSAMILTGDLNWDDERKRSAGTNNPLLSVANEVVYNQDILWQDSWLESKGAGHDGYTYDSKENPMLKGNLRRRFDRCVIFSPSRDIVTENSDLVGKDAIEGYNYRKEIPEWKYGKPTGNVTYQDRPLCASDHFGLVVKFKLLNANPTKRNKE
jgi:tyrosyl-DNA phosphodiesterase 2